MADEEFPSDEEDWLATDWDQVPPACASLQPALVTRPDPSTGEVVGLHTCREDLMECRLCYSVCSVLLFSYFD